MSEHKSSSPFANPVIVSVVGFLLIIAYRIFFTRVVWIWGDWSTLTVDLFAPLGTIIIVSLVLYMVLDSVERFDYVMDWLNVLISLLIGGIVYILALSLRSGVDFATGLGSSSPIIGMNYFVYVLFGSFVASFVSYGIIMLIVFLYEDIKG